AIQPRIGGSGGDGDGIDIARHDRLAQRLGGGDRQYAGAAADIDQSPRPAPAKDTLEQQKAAAGRAMVAGAESQRRLDLDGDVARPYPAAVMAAMDQEAPGPHRRETGERIGDPVRLGGTAKFNSLRCVSAGRDCDEIAYSLFIGFKTEISLDDPIALAGRPLL